MEGVRSVSEVLDLVVLEGYSFIPNSFGAKPADLGSREAMAQVRSLTDKTQIIEHLKKSLAYARTQVSALDPSTLTGTHKVMGQGDLTVTQTADHIAGDLHEHLGQLIAYARRTAGWQPLLLRPAACARPGLSPILAQPSLSSIRSKAWSLVPRANELLRLRTAPRSSCAKGEREFPTGDRARANPHAPCGTQELGMLGLQIIEKR